MPEPDLPQRTRERTPGSCFSKKTGRLYRFSTDGVQVIQPWPLPAAWTKKDNGPWLALRPWVDLSAASERHSPITWTAVSEMKAFKDIPQGVIAAVVDAHLDRHQWASLQLAARVPGGIDLLRDVPLLGAALACAYRIRPLRVARPLRSARALLRRGPGMKTWRQVAGWLGFEESAAFVRVLRRVAFAPDRAWSLELLDRLRTAWSIPMVRKRLLHAARLDRDAIEVVVWAAEHGVLASIHPDLVDGAFNQGHPTSVPRRCQEVAQSWPVMRPGRILPVIRTAEELDALREELRQEIAARFRAGEDRLELSEFPPPPLHPLPTIRPLTSEVEMLEESARMKNCLDQSCWARDARRRFGYAYQVSAGEERADLWLEPVRSGSPGTFRVREVRGPGNAPPSEACLRLIGAWLGEHRRRLKASRSPLGEIPAPWRKVWTALSLAGRPYPPELAWAADDIPF